MDFEDATITGMVDVKQQRPHGICRKIAPSGDFVEGTWRNGKRHGLQRTITKDSVSIQIFKEYERLS